MQRWNIRKGDGQTVRGNQTPTQSKPLQKPAQSRRWEPGLGLPALLPLRTTRDPQKGSPAPQADARGRPHPLSCPGPQAVGTEAGPNRGAARAARACPRVGETLPGRRLRTEAALAAAGSGRTGPRRAGHRGAASLASAVRGPRRVAARRTRPERVAPRSDAAGSPAGPRGPPRPLLGKQLSPRPARFAYRGVLAARRGQCRLSVCPEHA